MLNGLSFIGCRSSVVEHSLGKGEVDSSILSGRTRKSKQHQRLGQGPLPSLPPAEREQSTKTAPSVGENRGTLFCRRSTVHDPARNGAGAKRKVERVVERSRPAHC